MRTPFSPRVSHWFSRTLPTLAALCLTLSLAACDPPW